MKIQTETLPAQSLLFLTRTKTTLPRFHDFNHPPRFFHQQQSPTCKSIDHYHSPPLSLHLLSPLQTLPNPWTMITASFLRVKLKSSVSGATSLSSCYEAVSTLLVVLVELLEDPKLPSTFWKCFFRLSRRSSYCGISGNIRAKLQLCRVRMSKPHQWHPDIPPSMYTLMVQSDSLPAAVPGENQSRSASSRARVALSSPSRDGCRTHASVR